jgi:pyruvate,orthophosphate dikinase
MNLVKIVYFFGEEKADGNGKMKDILGGKGANLAEMCHLGLPIPPGFTISTSECREFYKNGGKLSQNLLSQIEGAIKHIEDTVGGGINFGGHSFPLLVSVRSGAPVSMPGMMDTILNLGLNDDTVKGLINKSGNERFALDSYRRFIQMYADVVMGVPHHYFESALDDKRLEMRVKIDSDLSPDALRRLILEYKKIVLDKAGVQFPSDPKEQLIGAISAVFKSWTNERADYYRRMYGISEEIGTAVTIQAMVFGNLGETSGTGVAFTRNPSNGENKIYGEYLLNAQGEDVVAGIRTPYPIDIASKTPENGHFPSLEEAMPEVYGEFLSVCKKLEAHYRDMQDIEFTIQEKKLWFLQTRNGKRTIKASVKIAYDLCKAGVISKEEAILRIDPNEIDKLLHHTIDEREAKVVIDKGLPASPGAASGVICFSPSSVMKAVKEGKKAILTRIETSPEDIEGMNLADGILTTRGGMTSHAAVVARGMGKVCVTSAKSMNINYANGEVILAGGEIIKEGETITINGSNGEVYRGVVSTVRPELSFEFQEIMKWVDEVKVLKVRANAETETDVKMALTFGAEGVGLCRTEHMFFDKERILFVRQMIIAESLEERKLALSHILPFQVQDFTKILSIMDGLPVNIRLLDPPLHEFLPQKNEEIEELAKSLKVERRRIENRISMLHEANPMLGHRGCRLGITYPEIYEMQVRAIFMAGREVIKVGKKPIIEIMIPLIVSKKELVVFTDMIKQIALEFAEVQYSVGTMIETPRASLMAHEIAEEAEYFSFGTNDLTQMTMGISRDDSSNFVPSYIEKGIFEKDPFVSLDVKGVGRLIEIAIKEGREVKPQLKASICGEHGGDHKSIVFASKVKMTYVSCSPFRVLGARLSAAIAEIQNRR